MFIKIYTGKRLCTSKLHIIALSPAIDFCKAPQQWRSTDTRANWAEIKFDCYHSSVCLLSVTCTYVDDRVLEFDVEPIVRNGNDGFIGMAKIFHPFPLKNWEWHLYRHKTTGMLKLRKKKKSVESWLSSGILLCILFCLLGVKSSTFAQSTAMKAAL